MRCSAPPTAQAAPGVRTTVSREALTNLASRVSGSALTKRSPMSIYAVIDPATGETVEEYETITDDELRAAIGRADEAHRAWAASSSVADRAALVRRAGELHLERRQE